ncbi:hypothetical protein [Metabacillus arenae]|uniref:Uncharacterized protein n=1 Tax=Metabacillus arenae TaxID=2771434 RepID=A0A926NR91_9BACI|nr:hypothetical protein [Metabacillus arenae]MBD1382527.1 hypothetical protein [Metabacillus arenae]
MPKDSEIQHSEATPHFDGKNESIINDSTSTQGKQMGVETVADREFTQKRNPFHLSQKKNEDFEQLGQVLGGKKVDE